MRASDADREAVVRTLLDALARGLLTLDEGDGEQNAGRRPATSAPETVETASR